MKTPSLEAITLKRGGHENRNAGTCAMEAVAWLAGEPHSDHPACTDPVLAAFARRLNDSRWPSDRARTDALRPILPLLIGTAGKMDLERMRWMFADAAVRTFAPLALDHASNALKRRGYSDIAAKLREHAKILRAIPAVTAQNWQEAGQRCREARNTTDAAAADAAYASDAADAAAAYATYAVDATYAATYATYATYAVDATYAATYATYAADAADADRLPILQAAADLLRRACVECRLPEAQP